VSGVKFGLRVACHDHYDVPVSVYDAGEARRGLQRIKTQLLPEERAGVDYF
jgi:hypothetical protein